jgi:Domain of unknown function (DUF4386)
MASEKRRARLAGLLYLIVAACGGFSELYVRAGAKVAGDAAATAGNIAASATLFRVGALTDLVNLVCFLVLGLVLYGLLKPVAAGAARAMLAFNAVSVAVLTANLVNHLAALQAATAGDDAQAMLFLDLHAYGYLVAGTFFGLWLLPLGWLLLRSGYAPRALGALVMAGSLGYVADLVIRVLDPAAGEALGPVVVLPSALAELSLTLWLLVKGLDIQPRPDRVPALV